MVKQKSTAYKRGLKEGTFWRNNGQRKALDYDYKANPYNYGHQSHLDWWAGFQSAFGLLKSSPT